MPPRDDFLNHIVDEDVFGEKRTRAKIDRAGLGENMRVESD